MEIEGRRVDGNATRSPPRASGVETAQSARSESALCGATSSSGGMYSLRRRIDVERRRPPRWSCSAFGLGAAERGVAGTHLSGGERQAGHGAMYFDASIIVPDEPTTAGAGRSERCLVRGQDTKRSAPLCLHQSRATPRPRDSRPVRRQEHGRMPPFATEARPRLTNREARNVSAASAPDGAKGEDV